MDFIQLIAFTFLGPIGIFFIWYIPHEVLNHKIKKNEIASEEIIKTKKMNKAIVFASIFVYVFVIGTQFFPSSKSEERKEINWLVSQDSAVNLSNESLTQILSTFEQKCTGIHRYPSAIESAKVDVYKSTWVGYPRDEYGWDNLIEIEIVIKSGSDIPIRGISGSTLYYLIGGKENPGIVLKKDTSALFYGIQDFKESEDTFIRDTSYSEIDRL